MVAKKKITVKNRVLCPTSKGTILGPINFPYIEKIENIWIMICAGCEVYESLDNGTKLKLNSQNFDTDNNAVVEVPKPIINQPVAHDSDPAIVYDNQVKAEETPVVEEVSSTDELSEDVDEDPDVETVDSVKEDSEEGIDDDSNTDVEESPVSNQNQNNNQRRNNKRNRNKNRNQNRNSVESI